MNHRHTLASLTGLTVLLIGLGLNVASAKDAPKDASASAGAGAHKIVKTLEIPGEGRWDYLTIDADGHRLYIPRATHTQVVDAESGKVLADWADTQGVHGVALVPDKHLAFTSNGRSNTIGVYDTNTNEKVTEVKAGTGPDAICYDEASKQILAFNHKGGSITFIEVGEAPAAGSKWNFATKDVEVGGTLEFGVVDGGGRAFVNVEDKSEVVEIDTKADKVLHHWPITGGEGPTGLALDPKTHHLFASCDGNSKMAVIDAADGKTIATLPIGAHCDGCAFDPGTSEAFAACGDGTLTVIKAGTGGKYAVTETIKTKPAARTIVLDPKSHLLYLPTAEMEEAKAGARPQMKPGTFQVVVVGK